eukprot:scaffold1156_cov394-Prasinococcus_capsulatus_cf.AAC.21
MSWRMARTFLGEEMNTRVKVADRGRLSTWQVYAACGQSHQACRRVAGTVTPPPASAKLSAAPFSLRPPRDLACKRWTQRADIVLDSSLRGRPPPSGSQAGGDGTSPRTCTDTLPQQDDFAGVAALLTARTRAAAGPSRPTQPTMRVAGDVVVGAGARRARCCRESRAGPGR